MNPSPSLRIYPDNDDEIMNTLSTYSHNTIKTDYFEALQNPLSTLIAGILDSSSSMTFSSLSSLKEMYKIVQNGISEGFLSLFSTILTQMHGNFPLHRY
jgi:hypothetical protein